ncbi:hypothetical protein HXX76_011425 [Chlamydomonas incerta]|uniref:Uncharacterized protein n=1 Tax=Chlamydomonas incerta TaxID=51695 RepID=A0A835SZF4_CHLIN|nr:hypothetical protein HXX76_011425 [Chlamydomonas incerta]|eukprot:KAG2428721.1 hypothetical protein HXX76_011425 [Chlamydomonas incerta]
MDDEAVCRAVEKWTVWAGSQPPANLCKVAALRLDWPRADGPLLTAPLAACIALWFPALKELSFEGCHLSALPENDPAQLTAIVSGGLARLPHLVKLTLPSWSLIGALGTGQQRRAAAAAAAAAGPAGGGGSQAIGGGGGGWLSGLQELEISSDDHEPVTDEIAAGVTSLRSLRVLRLSKDTAHDDCDLATSLVNLFIHVPPSLATLSILRSASCFGPLDTGMEATFEAGRLTEAAFVMDDVDHFPSLPMRHLGEVASGLLLPYLRAKRMKLPRLVVRRLMLLPGDSSASRHQATDEHLSAVKDLVQRCRTVEVREVAMSTDTHLPAELQQTAELLGQPQALRLVTVQLYPLVVPVLQRATPAVGQEVTGQGCSVVASGAGAAPSDGSSAQQQQQQQQQPAAVPPLAPSLPSPQLMVARAVQRLLARARVPAPAAGEPTPSSGVAQLLVLQGPLVAGLAQAPELVDGWVKWLAKAAAGPGAPWRWCYQLAPRALGGPALLLQAVGKAGAAVALHAAVQSVEPGAQLEAAWVAAEQYPGCPGCLQLPAPLLWCIQQDLDEIWTGPESGGNGGASPASGGCQPAARGGTFSGVAPPPSAPSGPPPPSLQEQARWLQQLGKVLEEELPGCKAFRVS